MSSSCKIIYIIGAGRSGTTLLDIILGNAPDLFSAGELNRFTKRNGIPHDTRDEHVSYFWQQVREELAREGYKNPGAYYELTKKYEYHSSFLHLMLPYSKHFKLYADYQKSLISYICKYATENFGKKVIIDSSKYPLRGFFLSKIFGGDISYIYIQRNPLAVVESFQKKDVEQPSKNRFFANAYLLAVNGLAKMVIKMLRQTNKVSTISYDELLYDADLTLQHVASELDIDLTVPKELIRNNLPLKVGYLFDGNRLRLENEVVFKKANPRVVKGKTIDHIFSLFHTKIWYKHN